MQERKSSRSPPQKSLSKTKAPSPLQKKVDKTNNTRKFRGLKSMSTIRMKNLPTHPQQDASKRIYIDSKQFEELDVRYYGSDFDIEQIKQHFFAMRQREQQFFIEKIQFDEETKEKFFYFTKTYFPEPIDKPELYIYDHPKKGKFVLTKQELEKQPGYRHYEDVIEQKVETQQILSALADLR